MGRKGKRGRNKKEKGGKEDHAGAAAFADDARYVLHLLSHENWHPLLAKRGAVSVQGHLAHKKQPPSPRTLGIILL